MENIHSLNNQIIEVQERYIESLKEEISALRNLKECYEIALIGLAFVAILGVLVNIFI